MSDHDVFQATSQSDQTAQLLQSAQPAPETGSDFKRSTGPELTDLEETVSRQQEIIEQQQATIEALEEALDNHRDQLQTIHGKLERLEIDLDGGSHGATTLLRYANLDPDERADELTETEQRAVTIYENWQTIAWSNESYDNVFVDTLTKANAKNNPSKLKLRLEQVTGEDLQWTQIYRAMKAVAKLSGGEPEHDEYGRTTITGMDFEYKEVSTADNQSMKRILREV